jgi:hypothetical protein
MYTELEKLNTTVKKLPKISNYITLLTCRAQSLCRNSREWLCNGGGQPEVAANREFQSCYG